MISKTLLIAVCTVLLAGVAQAHPPDSLSVSFDSAGTTMTVIVFHGSKNPQKHFVNRIVVRVNKEEIVQQIFRRQADNGLQEAVYRIIELKDGDKIEITGACNIAGKKSYSMIYKRPQQ